MIGVNQEVDWVNNQRIDEKNQTRFKHIFVSKFKSVNFKKV